MNYSKFEQFLGDWGPHLQSFIEGEECDKLYAYLKAEKIRGKKIGPKYENTYRAFKETPFEELKVVFLLMDPYSKWVNNESMADGVAMSCSITGKLQPSLETFYDGIEDDLYKGLKLDYERFPDLKYLCNQGIMMLNTALTVERDKTGSHTKVWRPFMQYLCEEVFAKMPNGLIFVLCGQVSQEMAKYINPLQHYIFELEHPAFAARKMRAWKHEKIFSKINTILGQNNKFSPQWVYETPPF